MKINNDEKKYNHEKCRRVFLKRVSTLFGGVAVGSLLSGNAIAVAMTYVQNTDLILTDGKVFNKNQLMLLKQVCAIVIPKTETLGAAEVDTHGFIDNQLFHCHTIAEQETAVVLLNRLDNQAQLQWSLSFLQVTSEQQFQLLTDLDLGQKSFSSSEHSDFKVLKQMICFGYYTSEVGATKELRYVKFPGGFKGSIPYKKSDQAWATKGLFS